MQSMKTLLATGALGTALALASTTTLAYDGHADRYNGYSVQKVHNWHPGKKHGHHKDHKRHHYDYDGRIGRHHYVVNHRHIRIYDHHHHFVRKIPIRHATDWRIRGDRLVVRYPDEVLVYGGYDFDLLHSRSRHHRHDDHSSSAGFWLRF